MTEQTEQPYAVHDSQLATETSRPASGPIFAPITNIVWYVAGTILALLGLRFALTLIGANAHNGLVSLVYNATWPLISLFFNLISFRADYDALRTELSTVVAMASYALIAWAIARLLAGRRLRVY